MSDALVKPLDLEELRGKPKRIYKLLKAGLFDESELPKIFDLGFPGEEMDAENDLHAQMQVAIVEATRFAKANAINRKREEVTAYMAKGYPGVKVDSLEDHVIEEIFASMQAVSAAEAAQAEPDEIPEIIRKDDDELMFVTASGEVVGFADAPRHDLEQRLILEWVGERMTQAKARMAGIEAEKQVWLDRIEKQYGPRVNQQARIIKRLEFLYKPLAEGYLKDLVKAHKGARALRSVKVGLLTLLFRKTSASMDVVDPAKAITWCEEHCPDAIKKSVLVSAIDDKLKPDLKPDESGLKFNPGGEDKFFIN